LAEDDCLVGDTVLGKRNTAGHAGKKNQCNSKSIAVHRLSPSGHVKYAAHWHGCLSEQTAGAHILGVSWLTEH
jgi:hypothetical protein